MSVSQLLSGEKQAVKARNLSRDVLEELRVKLWLVVPEQYGTLSRLSVSFPRSNL